MVALSLLGDSFPHPVLPVFYPDARIRLVAVGWLLGLWGLVGGIMALGMLFDRTQG